MSVQDDKVISDSSVTKDSRPALMGRRAIIKGGLTAMPAILTLQSGAALARSSNLISAAPPETTDRLGRTLCLDTNSVYAVGDSVDVYDLGEPPRAAVNIITDRDYYIRKNDPHSRKIDLHSRRNDDHNRENDHHSRRNFYKISEGAMCEGGTYWYNDRDGNGWQSVELPYRGIVVSSGAMTSISEHVIDTLI